MAYVSQELKQQIAPNVKEILKKYGIKGSLSVRHNSTLVLTLKSGKIDFIENHNRVCTNSHYYISRGWTPAKDYMNVNTHWYHEHFDGEAEMFLSEIMSAMNEGNYDNSDIQSDYFCVGWYVDINIGKWDKKYIVE